MSSGMHLHIRTQGSLFATTSDSSEAKADQSESISHDLLLPDPLSSIAHAVCTHIVCMINIIGKTLHAYSPQNFSTHRL